MAAIQYFLQLLQLAAVAVRILQDRLKPLVRVVQAAVA
jgi:hypothetical protein